MEFTGPEHLPAHVNGSLLAQRATENEKRVNAKDDENLSDNENSQNSWNSQKDAKSSVYG